MIYLLIISAFTYFILILYLAFILFLNNFQKSQQLSEAPRHQGVLELLISILRNEN